MNTMREFNEKSITQAVIGRLGECNESELFTAIQFLTDVGKTCTNKRQEFVLLSDTLGASVLVITLNHPADQGSAESTLGGQPAHRCESLTLAHRRLLCFELDNQLRTSRHRLSA
jgi:hypothetical protein